MTKEQIEDDIKRLKEAHAEDEGNLFIVLDELFGSSESICFCYPFYANF